VVGSPLVEPIDDAEDVEETESEGDAGTFISASSLSSDDDGLEEVDPDEVKGDDESDERGGITGAATTLAAAVLRQTLQADVHEASEQDEVQER